MKYIYMVCLALSSLFTYKQPFAENNMIRYAFFIPQNAFQRNVDIPEATRNLRKIPVKRESELKNSSVDSLPDTVSQMQKKEVKAKNTAQKNIANNKNIPIISSSESPLAAIVTKTADVAENKKKVKPTSVQKAVKQDIKPISERDLHNKSIEKLLALLPYPDFNQPKFKQLYAMYALDLRTFYRKGELLANPEQDEALAKANTMRRFEVK